MIINSGTIRVSYINLYNLINKKFGIPIFQRYYDWKSNQVKQLLVDLDYAIENDCEMYLLDFIYYLDNDKYMIADGQQRLVSINLLIKALNDYLIKTQKQEKILKIFDISYDNINNDKKYQQTIQKYPGAPFKDVYLEFYDWIESHNADIDKIISLIKTNIHIYMKECNNGDDAFVIFQQINTGGKPLNKDEIIRTAVDQYAEEYGISMKGHLTNLRQSFVSYYKFVKENPSVTIENIEIIAFLKNYITKDRQTFQNFVDTLNIIKKLEDNPVYKIIGLINRNALVDVLNILAMKQIDIKQKKEYFDKVMLPLILLSIVVSIKKGNPSIMNRLIKVVIELIKQNKSSNEISIEIAKYVSENHSDCTISFSDFNYAMGNPDRKLRGIKKALLILDVMISNTSGTVNIDSINLEHIYPQNPNINWVENGWPVNKEDQMVWVDNIGNYMLLAEAINKKIKNKYITDKVYEYNKIIPKDLILKTVMNTVDFARFETEKENYIKERCENITKLIRQFKFGAMLIDAPTAVIKHFEKL